MVLKRRTPSSFVLELLLELSSIKSRFAGCPNIFAAGCGKSEYGCRGLVMLEDEEEDAGVRRGRSGPFPENVGMQVFGLFLANLRGRSVVLEQERNYQGVGRVFFPWSPHQTVSVTFRKDSQSGL